MKNLSTLNTTRDRFKNRFNYSFDESIRELGFSTLKPKQRKLKYKAYTGCSSK